MNVKEGESGAIRLRALEPTDVDCLYLWENDPEIWQFGCTRAPMSRHRLWEYVRNYDARPDADGQLRLMVDIGGVPVGSVDIYDIDAYNGHAFVGIMIAPAYRRKGYASMALEAVVAYCRCHLGLRYLGALVSADNELSRRLFSKAGFREVALLGGWVRRSADSYVPARILICGLL